MKFSKKLIFLFFITLIIIVFISVWFYGRSICERGFGNNPLAGITYEEDLCLRGNGNYFSIGLNLMLINFK